jgi:hypothetical protein
MILYHGSNILVENIDLSKCKPYKDFGKGFYCTTIKEQAQQMAIRVANIFGGEPKIAKFELNEDVFNHKTLRIKKFDEPTKEWAMFVLNNRNRSFTDISSVECNHDNKFDLVAGPIANDDLALLFRMFQNGFIDINALMQGMEYKKLTNQYSFHTENVVKYIRFVGGI